MLSLDKNLIAMVCHFRHKPIKNIFDTGAMIYKAQKGLSIFSRISGEIAGYNDIISFFFECKPKSHFFPSIDSRRTIWKLDKESFYHFIFQ